MIDYQFYNVGGEGKGLARIAVFCRRILRRILRPLFQRQVDLFLALDARTAELAKAEEEFGKLQERMHTILQAHVCEREALTRRLAVLEDLVKSLQPAAKG